MWDTLRELLQETHNWLLIGLAIVLGHIGGKLAGRLRLPSILGYLTVGVIFGASVFNVVDQPTADSLALVTDFGLAIVAFIIGAELSLATLRRIGKGLVTILLGQFSGAVIIVFLAVFLLAGFILPDPAFALPTALIFAAVASATAPAGTVAVIQECRAKGPLTTMLMAIVGLDDALAIVAYAFAAAFARMALGGASLGLSSLLAGPVLEILGSLALGAATGLALTAACSRTRARPEVLSLTLGAILFVTGLSNVLHLSLILTNLALGMTVANLSKRETERAYSSIERITHPVYILFFVVAGAHLDIRVLFASGLLVPVYITGRSAGKLLGAGTGAVISRADESIRRYLGLGLLSQAGVAVGLALLTAREFSAYGEVGNNLATLVISTATASTVFFEIVGPVATRIALTGSGEANLQPSAGDEE